MEKQVSRIAVHQSSKTIAFIFFVMAFILGVLGVLYCFTLPLNAQEITNVVYTIVMAVVLYPIFIYVYFVIFFALYNFVAGKVGGITLTLKDK